MQVARRALVDALAGVLGYVPAGDPLTPELRATVLWHPQGRP